MDPYDGNLLLRTSPELLLIPAATLLSATISLLHSEAAKWATFGSLVVLLMFVIIFFRSPMVDCHGYSELGPMDMVSPADGVIASIDEVSSSLVTSDYGKIVRPQSEENDSRRITIFLSVTDKHFQCAPCDSTVQQTIFKRGEFHPAGFLEKSQYNERIVMELATRPTDPTLSMPATRYFVVLIAGIIARRILVFPEFDHKGADIDRGRKMSVIRFGSRVDLIIPKGYQIQARVGDRVRVGETVLALWRP